jgi:IS5 family transposase
MLRTVGDQPTLWESLLPVEALVMPGELVRVDALLEDDRFFEPYGKFFHATLGRPSIPIETYLRLMFLKFRYRLGFETLCREVTDSIGWQRFCRIPLGGRVPHPTTLMKITTRCGQAAVEGLNEALLAKAVEAKVLKTNRVRADTTVIEANVAYPSDSSLLAKGVAKMATGAKKLKTMGLATRTKLADKTRTVRSRARSINANLRRRTDDKIAIVKRINGELADVAERVARQADAVVRNARRKLRALADQASGLARAAVDELERTAALTRRIAAQTRQRLAGEVPPGATRVVSLHDADARPIAKGRLGKPVEFGYKAQLVDKPRRRHHRPQHRSRQPAGRADARAGDQQDQTAHRARSTRGHRGSRLRRTGSRRRPTRRRCALRRAPDQGPTNRGAPPGREPTCLQEDGAMAHRLRGTDQLRQTRLRTLQDADRRARRRSHLVRSRHLRPQPRQDQQADRLIDH